MLGTQRFGRFSCWKRLVNAIAYVKRFLSARNNLPEKDCLQTRKEAESLIIKEVQSEMFPDEIECIRLYKKLPKESKIVIFDPFIDENGLMRVGGRLRHAKIPADERHPIIIPGKHHVALLLIRHYHEKIKHQGRHFTSGAIRSAGYWIIGEKRQVSSVLEKCVICRKLRGQNEHQKMADLPENRITPGPPFTNVGIDTLGPWSFVTRKTRGGAANSKRWAIMFTCLITRAIHLDVVEDLSSSSFVNALKRFTAIRGPIKIIRSDCGTNFVGSAKKLKLDCFNVGDTPVKTYLNDNSIQWIFNAPNSSHMGGAWERMIGVTRRILDSMMLQHCGNLTNDVLVTFLADVCAIINSRPLSAISTDPEDPYPLCPSLILTQKPNVLLTPDVSFGSKDIYQSQWKRVQYLADVFWKKWRESYLQSLQSRQKWFDDRRNVEIGDIVLLKDSQVKRTEWPMGLITKVFQSSDEKVRKVEVRVSGKHLSHEKPVTYIRPVTELVVLIASNEKPLTCTRGKDTGTKKISVSGCMAIGDEVKTIHTMTELRRRSRPNTDLEYLDEDAILSSSFSIPVANKVQEAGRQT
ncbi:uncharacterized protein LOC134261921 [Saccostrea cucullata]|uniref:uncharacterized protein LOC134261921 n=1 Tax=Saccostrea cuccullata TaxID=36930 RepID=UPI002ED117BC